MAISRRTGRSRFTLLLLVLTSITVLTLDFRGDGMRAVRDAASTVFSPVRSVADGAFDPIGEAWNGVFDYRDLEAENERLRIELDEIRGDDVREENYAEQVEALLNTADIDFIGNTPQTIARVVGGSPSNFDETVELDKGSADGIKVDMPVVTGAGLVGKVVQVTGGSSVVRLVSDPSFVIGVRLVLANDVAVAHGSGAGRDLVVDGGIEPATRVREGASVVTSGLSTSLFPPDVPVGRVASVSEPVPGGDRQITIQPLADLEGLTYVNVMRWEPR
ncbi:rod shape-determining protein MreC [soil metagenome]